MASALFRYILPTRRINSGRLALVCSMGLVLAALQAAAVAPVAAQQINFELNEEEICRDDDEAACSYGPCPQVPRKTLFQWSYGTSFSGGPDPAGPVVTDRPDFTEASVTVGLGIVQLESGYTYAFDNDGASSVRSQTYPELLLRYGMFADWFELRLGWTYAEEETSGAVNTNFNGADDMSIGMKIALTPQECWLPETALLLDMKVPVGSAPFTANDVLPGGAFIYGWEINDFLATAGQTRFDRALDDVTGEPFLEFSQSWTVAYSLSEKWGAYTEWFMLSPDGADTNRTRHFFDGGFTYLVHNDLQLDVRAGVGLNEAAEDYFVGAGFVIRL